MANERRILLIGGDTEFSAGLTQLLASEQMSLVRRATGEQAVEEVDELQPALVLLDLVLPDVSGRQVLARVRAAHPYVPVIVFSAYAVLEEAVDCMRAGANDFLTRPVDRSRLLAAVRDVLNRARLEKRAGGFEQGLEAEGGVLTFEDYERRILAFALDQTGWNVKEAARRLRIGRATLYRKIDRYRLRERAQPPRPARTRERDAC